MIAPSAPGFWSRNLTCRVVIAVILAFPGLLWAQAPVSGPGQPYISVRWEYASGAASFRIYRAVIFAGVTGSWILLAKDMPSNTRAVEDKLAERGRCYFYAVTAVSAAGVESEVGKKVKICLPPAGQMPGKISTLKAEVIP